MKKFQFRLETLLRIRESERDQCHAMLAESRRAEEELNTRLNHLRTERNRLQQDCRKAAGPGELDLDWLTEAHRYALNLSEQEDELLRQMQILAEEIDRRREALLQADRKVHVLEKLREHRLVNHRQEQEREEAKHLDEVALLAIGR
jgi:flagellar protein FliJ